MKAVISYLTGGLFVLGLVVYFISWKANQKFDEFKQEFIEEQKRIEERLKKDYRENTDRLLESIEEDLDVTKGILEEFSKRPDANDPSGIPPEFLRQ